MSSTTTILSQTPEDVNPFTALIHAYCADPKDPKALTDLATAVTYSVLKKCINTGYNSTLVTVRRELAKALSDLNGIAYTAAAAYKGAYTEDGDYTTETTDPTAAAALVSLVHDTLGGGLDLVNTAVIAILEETKAQKERDPDLPHDLERVYTVRRLNRKVWIHESDSVNGWETVETSPIREIFKAVRRYISQTSAAATDPRNGYTYIESIATDPDSDSDSVIYRRLPKYANLGGYAVDANGAETFYTTDPKTVTDTDSMIDSLHLTPRQKKILDLRLGGYGYKAIATYLGVRPDSVRDAVKAIQKKAKAAGLDPENK